MVKSAINSNRVASVLQGLDPFQRDVIGALLQGEEESTDDALAERHGTTLREVRVVRIQARKRLRELLAELQDSGA